MAEEVSYSPEGMRQFAAQVTHSAEQPARRAEDLVMDAARYQDASKWGDGDLVVTREFGNLYGQRLTELEGDIHSLVREIAEFSADIRKAADEAGILDEMVSEQWRQADRVLASPSAQHSVTPKAIHWEG